MTHRLAPLLSATILVLAGCGDREQPRPAPVAVAPDATAATPPSAIVAEARVDLAAEGIAVSPYIYGMAMVDAGLANELGVTIRRMGGNVLSTWNWKTGFSSSGSD